MAIGTQDGTKKKHETKDGKQLRPGPGPSNFEPICSFQNQQLQVVCFSLPGQVHPPPPNEASWCFPPGSTGGDLTPSDCLKGQGTWSACLHFPEQTSHHGFCGSHHGCHHLPEVPKRSPQSPLRPSRGTGKAPKVCSGKRRRWE